MAADIKPIVWNGKQIGDVMNKLVFVAPRRSSKHIFRAGKPLSAAMSSGSGSWSFNIEVFEMLRQMGIKVFVIEDRDTARYYWKALDVLGTTGFVRNFGRGSQRYVPLKNWNEASSLDGILTAVRTVFGKEG